MGPGVFFIDFKKAKKKKKSFSAYYFVKVPVHLHRFSTIKSPIEVTKQ
jgi:hypothetical protein